MYNCCCKVVSVLTGEEISTRQQSRQSWPGWLSSDRSVGAEALCGSAGERGLSDERRVERHQRVNADVVAVVVTQLLSPVLT